MRLRDLGGLIVVDFIDMEESKNRREVEQRLRDALRYDRARVQFSSISKFGLLELIRQRLRPALSEGNHITCPRCNGTGHIRDTESSALQILRIIQEESMKDNTAAVHVQVPVEVTSFLLNEKRTEITKIELKQRVTVLLVPNKHLETPNYKLERLRHDDPRLENLQASYTMIEEPDDEVGDLAAREGQGQAGAGDQGRAARSACAGGSAARTRARRSRPSAKATAPTACHRRAGACHAGAGPQRLQGMAEEVVWGRARARSDCRAVAGNAGGRARAQGARRWPAGPRRATRRAGWRGGRGGRGGTGR